MAFFEGRRPALQLPKTRIQAFCEALAAQGYGVHNHHRIERRGEIGALRRTFRSGGENRQIHVQLVCLDGACVEIYAHTEPSLDTVRDVIKHGFAALFDRVSYPAGARMLLRDLAAGGFALENGGRRKRTMNGRT